MTLQNGDTNAERTPDEADGEIKEYFSRTESVPKDRKWGLSKHVCRLRYYHEAVQCIPKVPQFHLNHSNINESIEVELQDKNGVDKCVPAGRGRAGHETLTGRSGGEGARQERGPPPPPPRETA